VLLYAYMQQRHLTILEASSLVASAWPLASCIIFSWSIAEVNITMRIPMKLGEPKCPNLCLLAGIMAIKAGEDDKHMRGLLRHHGYLDFYTISRYDMRRRSLIYEDRYNKSWNEILDGVIYGLLAPIANDLDSLSAVDKKGKLQCEGELTHIAADFLGCSPAGAVAQLTAAVGLEEHVRDPLADVQLAVWGMRGLANFIRLAPSTYGNVQMDRYGIVQTSASHVAAHLVRLQTSLHEYMRCLGGVAARSCPGAPQSALLNDSKFRSLDTALNGTIYQIVAAFHKVHRPTAAVLPRVGGMGRRAGGVDPSKTRSMGTEIKELPLSYISSQAGIDDEASFMKARDDLRGLTDKMSNSVRHQHLADVYKEPRLREIEQRVAALKVEQASLQRSLFPSRMQKAQSSFEASRFQGEEARERQPLMPLGDVGEYSFPYQETRMDAFDPYGGIAASINPREPNGDPAATHQLRLAVISEELMRLEKETFRIVHSGERLHYDVDKTSKRIVSAEEKLSQERDDALVKRSKRTEMLQTLQRSITKYDDFFLGHMRHS